MCCKGVAQRVRRRRLFNLSGKHSLFKCALKGLVEPVVLVGKAKTIPMFYLHSDICVREQKAEIHHSRLPPDPIPKCVELY
jgi:hypothetical protein